MLPTRCYMTRRGNRYTRSVFAWFADVFVAILVFGATNIDDILLLALFFADGRFRSAAVFTGQFAGIGLLTAVSAAAAFLALSIPAGWVALLGLVPLVMGVRGLYGLWRSSRLTESGDEVNLDREKPAPRAGHSQWISVAFVTVANGGDNLGVYIPLFSQDFSSVPLYVVVFAVMTAIWCGAGYWLVSHLLLGPRIRS